MRLVSYGSERGVRAGFLRDGRVMDAWDGLGGDNHPTVRNLLARGLLGEAEAQAKGEGLALGEVELQVPLPDPDKIICIGLNYRSHAAEAGIDPPAAPDLLREVPERPRPVRCTT